MTVRVAAAQLEVDRDWRTNLDRIDAVTREAASREARLVLLPEGLVSRDPADVDATSAGAQPLDGPFVTGLRAISERTGVVVAGTVHVPTAAGRATNVLVVLDRGEVVAAYTKLHLYDAFASRESDRVDPGDEVPPLVEVDGMRFGLMTCYDVRFPELALAHALAGADALLLPAAWVRGPLKDRHWETLVTARALENTVYVVASGEVSARNLGGTMVVDPLGVTIARAAEVPGLVVADLSHERIDQVRADLPVLANRRFGPPALADRLTVTHKERN